jgi:aldose 1-epimerase
MRITSEPFGKFRRVRLINDALGESVSIIPEFGANINELVLSKGGKSHSIILGYKDCDELVEHRGARSAKLSPFPNRIRNGKYSFNGKEYALPVNPRHGHAIHGLIFNKEFAVKERKSTKSYASITLQYDYRHELEGYPFDFSLEIKYTLNKNGFKCETTAINTGSTEMPFGDGWHPYFRMPEKVDDFILKIPAKTTLEVDERMIPTGAKGVIDKFLTAARIESQQFDTGFVVEGEKGRMQKVATELYDPSKEVKIIVWQEAGPGKYNYIQLYIPPSRECIAVEPMSCAANAFNSKEGLIVLSPGGKFSAKYGVRLE